MKQTERQKVYATRHYRVRESFQNTRLKESWLTVSVDSSTS